MRFKKKFFILILFSDIHFFFTSLLSNNVVFFFMKFLNLCILLSHVIFGLIFLLAIGLKNKRGFNF